MRRCCELGLCGGVVDVLDRALLQDGGVEGFLTNTPSCPGGWLLPAFLEKGPVA